LAVVAVAPGAAAPPDDPSGDGSLESLFEGHGEAGARAGSAGRARSGAPEARTTTIDLSTAADPVPRRRGVVPLRHIVGARPPSARWQARARRSVRVGGWVAAAATVSAGLAALWVLLFTAVSGGDVWLGRPLTPTKHDENVTQQDPVPASPGAGSLRPTGSTPPKPAAAAATKAATPSDPSGRSGGGSATATAGSGGSGRSGADDPPGDDAGGTLTTATTSGGGSGSGSGHGSGGSGSGGGSGGHGADN
jgi:hypothetical protein